MPITSIALLAQTAVAELRDLNFPYPGDATDVFTLKTDQGTGYLDQGTGAALGWTDLTGMERVSETIYMLHTGQGAALLGVDLSRICAAPSARLSHLPFEGDRAFPAQC